jgi:excisionase family DNA binding protein
MPAMFSLDQAADYLGVSIRSVRRPITSGELKAYRVGSQTSVRIKHDDLENILNPVVPEAD